MRKIVCLLTALILCLSMVVPAFAAENGFVPSITYKPNPEIVPVEGPDGEEHIGVVRDKDGEIIDYVGHGCLLITPIAHVWDEEIDVPAEIEQLLTKVYDALNDGSMKIPYEKHEANLDAANMVIRDLFDARWVCEEHRAMIEEEGVTFEITFDLGVVADAEIFVMTYDEAVNEWAPIVKTVNNGDGTVTCIFEHLCAIEFSIPVADVGDDSPQTGDTADIGIWIIVMATAAIMLVAIIAIGKKTKSAV